MRMIYINIRLHELDLVSPEDQLVTAKIKCPCLAHAERNFAVSVLKS